MDLIIFAHPDNRGSHNAAVLRYVQSRLKADCRDYKIIDLYADNFDPLVRVVEGDRPSIGNDEEVKAYQLMVRGAERLIFIYPVWWYNMPAIMKGFIEKVFTGGFAFDTKVDKDGRIGVVQLLKGKTAVVINTFGHGEALFRKRGRMTIETMDIAVLDFCGIECRRVNWFSTRGIGLLKGDVAKEIDAALR